MIHLKSLQDIVPSQTASTGEVRIVTSSTGFICEQDFLALSISDFQSGP